MPVVTAAATIWWYEIEQNANGNDYLHVNNHTPTHHTLYGLGKFTGSNRQSDHMSWCGG
jgi:hypothetical protein